MEKIDRRRITKAAIEGFRYLCLLCSFLGMVFVFCTKKEPGFIVKNSFPFSGNGTRNAPYLIKSKEELSTFRDLVNSGESFDGKYFLQTANINLENAEWTPIGIYLSGNYFCGTYDGDGHYIENLRISEAYPYTPANVGLFGMLRGVVENLGIESGLVEGDFCAALASHSIGAARIINCYNKANVNGTGRAGGICDNFSTGIILNCVNSGIITAPEACPVISYSAGLAAAIFPDVLPHYFEGEYKSLPLVGDSEQQLLNSGLDQLLHEGVINKADSTRWG